MHVIDIRGSDGQLIILGGSIGLPTSDHSVVSPQNGSIRWNVATNSVEFFNGSWFPVNRGSIVYSGTWNATTNTPTILSGVGVIGQYYKVSVAGNTTIDGINNWYLGDSIIFDGTTWDKLAGTDFPTITLSGDVTGSGTTNISTSLSATGVSAGTYTKLTVDTKGRITAATNTVLDDLSDVIITSPETGQVISYNGSDWINIHPPYDIYGAFIGIPLDSQILWQIVFARSVTLPIDLIQSVAICDIAPSADASLTILKNGISIGSINFLTASTTAGFTFPANITFNSGDIMKIEGPSPYDSTFTSPSWAFVGYR